MNRISHRWLRRPAWTLALVLLSWAPMAQALAPEHEIRRLMLAVEEAVDDEAWGQAGGYLNRLQTLEGVKPVAYQYYRGRVMLESEHYNEANAALERYVEEAGEEGRFYEKSLRLMTRVEQARNEGARRDERATGGEPLAMIEPAGDTDMGRLRKLYLTDSDLEALQIHLNSLLELSGWRQDRRVVDPAQGPDIHYRVSTEPGTLQIRESRRTEAGDVRTRSRSLGVYGIRPSVDSACPSGDSACWIYDPRDDSRMLKLSRNADQAREIASTLGRLIRQLQNPAGNGG